tara:strand:- start:214 stop:450 length:237 start_codon:yes stop_codon:yes gene_type:complete
MDLYKIEQSDKAFPGEYIYHEPTNRVVLCAFFDAANHRIRVMSNGKMFFDKIENFKKIKLNTKERTTSRVKTCKGCGK